MTKERTSLSLDPDVAEYLKQDRVNASGLVNDLVKRHMNGGVDDGLIREFRKEQLRGEIESAEKTLETKQRQLEKMKEQEREERDEYESGLEDAAELLPDPPERDAENPAVKAQATNLGVSPEELLDDLAERDL